MSSSGSSGDDDRKRLKCSPSSLSAEEAEQKGNTGGAEEADQGGDGLKKGPWTSAEDDILIAHVKKHGGNWNAVQKYTGLARCGKSCRLRWANHLRPDLRKGAITAEEERRILELHFKMGKKWAQIAALLPGRTDNEIKNFWNTRYKKRTRANLPVYPDEIRSKRLLNGNQESADTFTNEASQSDETGNLSIPAVEFKDYKLREDIIPPCFDIRGSGLLGHRSDSTSNNLYGCSSSHVVPTTFDQCIKYPITWSPPFNQYQGYNNLLVGIHAMSNISSSELPSLQYLPTQQYSWSCMPALIQPPPFEPYQSVLTSPHLLDSLQVKTETTVPNEADISTQWADLEDQSAASILSSDYNTHHMNMNTWSIDGLHSFETP